MELLAAKFNSILVVLKKKNYDFLDQRKTDFDTDYDEFKKSIQELHVKFLFEKNSLIFFKIYKNIFL